MREKIGPASKEQIENGKSFKIRIQLETHWESFCLSSFWKIF